MTLGEYYRKNIPSKRDPRSSEELQWLLEELLHLEKGTLFLHEDMNVSHVVELFDQYWNKLKKVPIQYIFNYQMFLNHRLTVNKDVLIPRQETEELTLLTIRKIKEIGAKSVLDIGTGSGAIIISILLACKDVEGHASDISYPALRVAMKNAKAYNLSCEFELADVYDGLTGKKFDFIISNPPYIARFDYVEKRVKKNEPHIALYAKNSGLEVYEKIIKNLEDHLNKNGYLYLEIDEARKEEITYFTKKYLKNSKISFAKDMSGHLRFCFIQLL